MGLPRNNIYVTLLACFTFDAILPWASDTILNSSWKRQMFKLNTRLLSRETIWKSESGSSVLPIIGMGLVPFILSRFFRKRVGGGLASFHHP
jgi:hypothetical protein